MIEFKNKVFDCFTDFRSGGISLDYKFEVLNPRRNELLSQGFNMDEFPFQYSPTLKRDIDSILEYINLKYPNGGKLKSLIDSDIICSCNLLTKIIACRQKKEEITQRLKIEAIRKNGVIFLSEILDTTEDSCRSWKWSSKFRQLITLDENGQNADPYAPLHEDISTRNVIKSTITRDKDSINLYYSGQIDCVDENDDFVQSRYFTPHQDVMLKAFFRCYFSFIPTIIIAKKNGLWTIGSNKLKTLDLPELWQFNKNECLEYLFSVLNDIQLKLCEDGDACVLNWPEETLKFIETVDFIPPSFFEKFN